MLHVRLAGLSEIEKTEGSCYLLFYAFVVLGFCFF